MMKKAMGSTTALRRDQRGIISLMMTLVMMIVISLIVLGLAQMSRREQRQSLDSQLSLQAFYAAESGVNDAVAAATKNPASVTDSTDCSQSVAGVTLDSNLSLPDNVAYTCVLVSNAAVVSGNSATVHVWPLQYADPTKPINTITVSWTPGQSGKDNSACPSLNVINSHTEFTTVTDWAACPFAVERIDLVPASGDNITQNGLVTGTMTTFLVPNNAAAGAVPGSTGFQAGPSVHAAVCDSSSCQLQITGLTATKYYIRLIAIYNGGSVSVGGQQDFSGAQLVVDSTGKAQDVLRRIKETVDLVPGNMNASATEALVSGDSVCKRWAINADGFPDNASDSLDECQNL